MNTLLNNLKTRFLLTILTGTGMIFPFHGLASASQTHEQVKTEMAQATQITIDQAVHTAIKEVPGIAIKAELEREHGPLMWEIEIVTPEGTIQEVHLDGRSGKRLALKEREASEIARDSGIHAGPVNPESKTLKEQSLNKTGGKEVSKNRQP